MNYRSVVAFGKGRALNTEEEKMHALDIVSEQLCQGRWEGARTPSEKELLATSVVAVDIDFASAKIRTGGANDDEEDLAGPWWAGVLPVETKILTPIPSDDLKINPNPPQHVQDRVGDVL
jgi:hypothetical protein